MSFTFIAFNQFDEPGKSSGRRNVGFHGIVDFDPVVSDDDFVQ